ncbi:MAG: hypothetical protein QW528_03600, partial [Candidatus Micrarchaeaceae archaeon]
QATTGQRGVPDIETKEFAIEIETGLKHSLADLKARLARYNKRIIIVVPNSEVAERYLSLKDGNIEVATLDELAKLLKATK